MSFTLFGYCFDSLSMFAIIPLILLGIGLMPLALEIYFFLFWAIAINWSITDVVVFPWDIKKHDLKHAWKSIISAHLIILTLVWLVWGICYFSDHPLLKAG